jgi:hypothetical protein
MHNFTRKLSDAPEGARPRSSHRLPIVRPIAMIAMMDKQHDHATESEGPAMTNGEIVKEFEFAGKKRVVAASLARRVFGVFSSRSIRIARALFLTAGLTAFGTSAYAAPTTFAKLAIPVGVEADRAGNVYVDSDATFTTVLTKFTAAGSPVAQASIGGITVGNLGHIARIPNSDFMVLLTSQGQIVLFTTDVKPSLLLDLSPLNFTTTTALDVTANAPRSFTLGLPSWGDITAVSPQPNLIYLYLTATTGASGGFPFVLRLAFDLTANSVTPTVVATSSGTTAGNANQPRGIAVNSLGWVLTGFPFAVPNAGFADSLVAFTTSFPEVSNAATRPRFILPNPNTSGGLYDMASNGMSTDAVGNFYIATGAVGSSICGRNGSGALVLVSGVPARPNLRCVNLPAILASSIDVAVSPVNNIPYMTVQDQVVRLDPLVVGNAAAAVRGATPDSRAILRLAHRRLTLKPLH